LVSLPLVELWEKRSLILNFALMNIKIRYKGTKLGLLWTAVEPSIFFIFLYFLFTSINFTAKENFAIYLLTGIVLYHAFVRGTQVGMMSLRENYPIISSLNIRREFFPVAATTTSGLLLVVEIAVLFILMLFFSFVPETTVFLLVVVLVLLITLILGISYVLSIVSVYLRDIQPLWGVFTSALFFITPIFWYLEDAFGFALEIQKLNPVGQIVELGHKVVLGQIPPLNDWLYTSAIIIGILVFGYGLFQKYQNRIVEEM